MALRLKKALRPEEALSFVREMVEECTERRMPRRCTSSCSLMVAEQIDHLLSPLFVDLVRVVSPSTSMADFAGFILYLHLIVYEWTRLINYCRKVGESATRAKSSANMGAPT